MGEIPPGVIQAGPKISQFVIGRMLGKGGFGCVLQATRKSDGRAVVIKSTLHPTEEDLAMAQREAEMLQAMHHPFVVSCYESFAEGGNFYIVTEFCDGDPCDLFKLMHAYGRMPESEVIKYLRMICSALAHVHHRNVVHRDIKPANVFLMRDGTIKIGDFGLGRSVQPNMAYGLTQRGGGTERFVAPELLTGGYFSSSTDIFALGVTCFWLLTGQYPFDTLAATVRCDPPVFPPGTQVSQSFSKLLAQMMDRDPSHRPTAKQVEASPLISALPVVVWRDPRVRVSGNERRLRKLQQMFAGKVILIACETNDDAYEVIAVNAPNRVWIVTNRGDDGELFIAACRERGIRNKFLIFCSRTEGLEPGPDVIVDTKDDAVQQFIIAQVPGAYSAPRGPAPARAQPVPAGIPPVAPVAQPMMPGQPMMGVNPYAMPPQAVLAGGQPYGVPPVGAPYGGQPAYAQNFGVPPIGAGSAPPVKGQAGVVGIPPVG